MDQADDTDVMVAKLQKKLKEKNDELVTLREKVKEDAGLIKELRDAMGVNAKEISNLNVKLDTSKMKECIEPGGLVENHRGEMFCPLKAPPKMKQKGFV